MFFLFKPARPAVTRVKQSTRVRESIMNPDLFSFPDFYLTRLYWRESYWFLMLFLPVLFVIIPYIKQQTIWQAIADKQLFAWLKTEQLAKTPALSQTISKVLLSLSWCLLCIALAGPRTVKWLPPGVVTDSVGIILIVDFSASMKTTDAFKGYKRINRIQQAENIISGWLTTQFNNQSQLMTVKIGLTIFSGQSHQIMMPSTDLSLLRHFSKQLHLFSPPLLGNNLSAALQSSLNYHQQQSQFSHLVLISDGDMDEKSIQDANKVLLKLSEQSNVSLTIIGVGNSEASRIPLNKNTSAFLNDKVVVSRREVNVLKKIASASGIQAKYYDAESLGEMRLSKLLNIEQIRIKPEFYSQVLWHEWFFIPLFVALALILLALQINTRKKPPTLLVLSMIMFLTACQSQTETKRSQQQLKYQNAFIEGTHCYREKKYACAKNAFSYAAWLLKDNQYRGPAVFNLANSHFKLGDFDQASVLFQDAQLLGVDKNKTQLNKSFADSLSLAVRRRIADITKTQQRAEWFAAARKLPEEFNELIADGLYLKQTKLKQNFIASFKTDEQQRMFNRLLERGLKRYSKVHESTSKDFWVSSQPADSAHQTAQLFNHLMPIEAGLHYMPDEPIVIDGVRPW
jgi:hypothetical protein